MTTSTKIAEAAGQSGQARRILAILEAAGLDFLVERTPAGWRVETEQQGSTDGYSCAGASLTDALAQLTQALTCDLQLQADEDGALINPNAPVPYAVDTPVEFCERFLRPATEDDWRSFVGTEIEGDFLQQVAE